MVGWGATAAGAFQHQGELFADPGLADELGETVRTQS